MANEARRHRASLESLFEAWLANDSLQSAAHFSESAAYREAGGATIVGRPAITEHFARFFRDGPSWRFDVDAVLVEGDHAAVRYRFALTDQKGVWREHDGCAFVRFKGQLIEEWREYKGN
jgi:hypothetical protein